MSDYGVQINVKIGDHLVNVTGDTVEEVMVRARELRENHEELHSILSDLDGGRPATEIVQKEKQWGARSQGGRSYGKGPAGGGSWAKGKGAPGAWQGGSQAPAVDIPEQYKTCPAGHTTEGVPGGQNKATGKPYSARIQCKPCDLTLWQQKDGSWA